MADKMSMFTDAAKQMGYSDDELKIFMDSVGTAPAGQQFESLATQSGFNPEEISTVNNLNTETGQTQDFSGYSTNQILGDKWTLNTPFGARSSADIYSGGINYGPDLGVPTGTTVAAPPDGKWEVVESFGGATPGVRSANRGYGNSVMIKNMLTGEMLRYSHLGQVGVQPGQVLEGGSAFGATGLTGNTTGPHLDLEMYTSDGKITDPLKSKYAKYL